MKIILASKSPRRKELLSQIGMEYECIVSHKEENITSHVPGEAVKALSLQKAEDVYEMIRENSDYKDDMLIIGADTVVACDGVIMGKPRDNEDAKTMLRNIRGHHHSVWTGVTLISVSGGNIAKDTFTEETKVYMYDMTDGEIDEYVESGEPLDKAGSYAIQGIGAKYIERIEGDYNNVVGLPVGKLYQKIKGIL